MVKKESARRGYMNSEEVEKHLEPFSKSLEGDNAKVNYLNKALAKPKLLSQQTKVNVRRNLAKIHTDRYNYVEADLALIENGGEDYKKAIEDLKEREGNTRAADVLEKYNEFEAAARIYANIGYEEYNQRSSSNIDFDKVRKTLTRAADLYEKAGQLGYAANAIIRAHIGTHKGEVEEGIKYGALIEKVAEAEKEEHLSQKVRYFQEARERYQVAGKTAKVLAIGKKLGPLEEKLEAEKKRRGYAIVGITGAIGGISLLSSKITGNVIGSMTTSSSSILGASLIVVGLIGGFFWVQNRRQK